MFFLWLVTDFGIFSGYRHFYTEHPFLSDKYYRKIYGVFLLLTSRIISKINNMTIECFERAPFVGRWSFKREFRI